MAGERVSGLFARSKDTERVFVLIFTNVVCHRSSRLATLPPILTKRASGGELARSKRIHAFSRKIKRSAAKIMAGYTNTKN